jgi:hypothetical protein
MESETGVFRMNIDQGSIPLIPVLKALGIDDKQLEDEVGAELVKKK